MSTSKNAAPSTPGVVALEAKAEEVAALLSSMANAKRLLVLCQLVEGERSVGDLAEVVGLSQSALSQHLAKMRLQGLVETRREAQTVYTAGQRRGAATPRNAPRHFLRRPCARLNRHGAAGRHGLWRGLRSREKR